MSKIEWSNFEHEPEEIISRAFQSGFSAGWTCAFDLFTKQGERTMREAKAAGASDASVRVSEVLAWAKRHVGDPPTTQVMTLAVKDREEALAIMQSFEKPGQA